MPRANRNHTLLMLLLVLLLVGQCLFIDSGIPGFTKRTKVMFKPAWRKLPLRSPPVPFDHVCIDMNQLLHCGARLAKEHEYASLFCKLDHLLRVVQPRKSLVLAFDGPAPLAKLQLQRSRRLADPENTQATPGTPFMDSMDDAMAHFVGQRWRRPAFRNINVFISGATVPGEGEIKIVRWINTHVKSPDDTVVLCGSDADMLVQAMALHPIKLSVLQSERSDHQVCSTSHVVMTLVNETRKAIGSAVSSCATPAEVADHVLLFLLLGNDYIPRLCQASDYSVIAAYRVAMASRRPSGEGLLDRSSKSFSFPALYAFMTALHSAHLQSFGLQPSFESSHQTYTSNARYLQEMSVLHELLAHRHCNMIWNPTHVDCLHLLVLDNNTQCMPGDRMFNGSKVLAEFFKTNVKLKRRGRNEVAAAALAVLFPQAHALRLQLTASVPGGARIAIMPPYDVTHRVYDWTAREKADGAPVPGYQQDVVAYLRGLLWISHIITSGVCSDVGYSYHGHYQITPSFVIAYLHEQLDRYRGTNKTYGKNPPSFHCCALISSS